MKVYSYFTIMMSIRPQNRIKELREKKRMKQSVLANKVGIFQSEISEIETGERMPNIYLAERIAKALGKNASEVFS